MNEMKFYITVDIFISVSPSINPCHYDIRRYATFNKAFKIYWVDQ